MRPRKRIDEPIVGPPEKIIVEEELRELGAVEILLSMNTKLEELVNVLAGVRLKEKIDFSFTYPNKTLPIGDTVIDFLSGDVRLADGTTDKLDDNLQNHDRRYCRSFYLEPDKNITYELDGGQEFPVLADDYVMEGYQNFQRITITTTSETIINAWSCTNPQAFLRKAKVSEIRSGAEIRKKISTDKDTHFTGAITAGEAEEENVSGLITNRLTVLDVAIKSTENIHYQLLFFSKDTFESTDPDVDTFLGFLDLDIPADGFRIGTTGLYYYELSSIGGLVDYVDDDGTKELHVALRAVGTNKSAGAAGAVTITLQYVPRIS